jgi:tetratricopeptide (TPR) repeat protein
MRPLVCHTLLALVLSVSATQLNAEQPPVDPLKLVQQGRRLNAEGKQADALALYQQALKASPDLFEAHLASGIALDLMGRYADARQHLTRAIALAPPEAKVNALDAMAVSYAFERNAAQGAAFYQQAFDLESADRPASAAEQANALGRLYLETGDTKNARRWYQTGYEMSRRQKDEPGSQLDLWHFRWLHAQARIAVREKRYSIARTRRDEAKALVAKTKSLSDQGAALAYLDGYLALYSGKPKAALAALASADQTDPFVVMLEALASEKAQDKASAETFWRKVLTFNGHSLQNAFARPVATKALSGLLGSESLHRVD